MFQIHKNIFISTVVRRRCCIYAFLHAKHSLNLTLEAAILYGLAHNLAVYHQHTFHGITKWNTVCYIVYSLSE